MCVENYKNYNVLTTFKVIYFVWGGLNTKTQRHEVFWEGLAVLAGKDARLAVLAKEN